MAFTRLDPTPALVVIDLQKGIVTLPTAHPAEGIVARAAALARAFRERGLPVILVNVAGRAPGRTDATLNFSPPPDWAELAPGLGAQPTDLRVTKLQVGAFYGTALELILRRCGVTQIVLAGISTSFGVESTARAAFDQGYNVVFAEDAMTDRDPACHQHSVEKIFPRIGQVTTSERILAAFAPKP